MFRNPTLLLRALSALLTYPDAELRTALPEIADAIRTSRALKKGSRKELLALVDDLAGSAALDAEARYVELFDRGRHTSLNLFEHVHGDGRQRGPAMLELRERYLQAGLEPVANELPDHLPLLLEYLSCRSLAETRATIIEIAHILRKLGNTLRKRGSAYAAVMAALLALGHEKGLDATAFIPMHEDRRQPGANHENIDEEWQDPPAFGTPETQTGVAVQPDTQEAPR